MSEEMNNSLVPAMRLLLALGGTAPALQNTDPAKGTPFAIVPSGVQAIDLKGYFPPQRIHQTVKFQEAGSFIEYVNRFKGDDTLIFASLDDAGAVFLAVLDYHEKDLTPRYLAHKAEFQTMQTPEFKVLLAVNKVSMSQVQFAEFLEENMRLFTEPAGAELLELVQTLYGKQDVRFDTATRLQSGANRLHYDEDVELRGSTSTKEGTVELPKEVIAQAPLFLGGAPYVVRMRLKYRIDQRKLNLRLEIVDLQKMVRDALLKMVEQIALPQQTDGSDLASGTGIVPLLGKLT